VTAATFIFVTGYSPGAVDVPMHGAYIAEAYKRNPVVETALVTDSFQSIIR